ncbi:hypothetical protein [Nitratifractor sp.]|uniref:hypothetical protein n=1 Tax=Nitratifractor sp. TaxID=2268144 RepID=UPI0025FD5190|nr:hypothetical protein [Nitratifractor sp.]
MNRSHLEEATLKKLLEIVEVVKFDIEIAEKLDSKTTYYGYILERLENAISGEASDLRIILAIAEITSRMAAYYTVYELFLSGYGSEGWESSVILELSELIAEKLGIEATDTRLDDIKTICEAIEVLVGVHRAQLILANFKVLDGDKNRNARLKRTIRRVEKDLGEIAPYLKESRSELDKILASLDNVDDTKYLDMKALIDISQDLTKKQLIDECKTGFYRADNICRVFTLLK